MSTHFRPRPLTSGPPSPTRPSTARSTIRAISPSPPPSLSDAVRLDLASTGTPNFESRSTPESARVGFKSDGCHQKLTHGFDDQETEFANHVVTTENGELGGSPADLTANVTIKRGGGLMGRRSPVKRSSRSSSSRKRLSSTAMEFSSGREFPLRDDDQDQAIDPHEQQSQAEGDSDSNWDCPDTPTPMTNSQKRSAYLPLGTPTPFPNPKRSSKPKTNSDHLTLTPTTTSMPPAPRLEFFESFHEESSYEYRDLDANHANMLPQESEKLQEFEIQNERRKMRKGAEARARMMKRRALISQTGHSSPTKDGVTMRQAEREQEVHQRTHLALPQHAVDMPLRKPVTGSTANMQRQISISEASQFSGGTVSSKRSVFSTPGRDELERKKALVEDDEGPFAKAVSMADLEERRRVVSEQRAGDDRRAAILEAEGSRKKKKGRACGLGVGCNVM